MDQAELERQYFIRGKDLLGRRAGSLLARLLKSKGGNIALARAELERASTKENPREWLAKVSQPRTTGRVCNGYAEEWQRKAAAQIADRRAASVPTEDQRQAVAAIHDRYSVQPVKPDPIPQSYPQDCAKPMHGRRVLADLERRRQERGG